jgi:pimeloyl-ACP methyl ester carboxylesterase
MESFTVPIARGATMAVDLVPGPGDRLLLLLPGFWRTARSPRYQRLRDQLALLGPVAAVTFRGHGDSTGTYTFGTEEPADLGLVVAQLAARGHRRIGILGLSMGGTIGMAMARLHLPPAVEVLAAALVSSPTDVRRARPRFWSWKVLRQLQASEAVRWPRFDPRHLLRHHPDAAARPPAESFPVAIFHNEDDWLIPDTEAPSWAAGLGARARVTIFHNPGRYHADAMLAPHHPLSALLSTWWSEAAATAPASCDTSTR